MRQFQKKALSSTDLVQKITSRGLVLQGDDQGKLYKALKDIGYYRLTGFFIPFQFRANQNSKAVFDSGAKLSKILALYEFDTALRALSSKALEKIEIALKTSICDHMCRTHTPHWYMDANVFASSCDHPKILSKAAEYLEFDLSLRKAKFKIPVLPGQKPHRKPPPYLEHYYNQYSQPDMPPAWMLREAASFGFWAKIYKDLSLGDRKAIASKWQYPDRKDFTEIVFSDWLWSVSIYRNRCAHHSRITHRKFPFAPLVPSTSKFKDLFISQPTDLRSLLLVIAIFLNSFDNKNMWKRELWVLFDRYSGTIDVGKATGFDSFESDWRDDRFWNF